MVAGSGSRWLQLGLLLPFMVSAGLATPSARGQFTAITQYELSEVVDLDEVDHSGRTHLLQLDAYAKAGQWDEALNTLRLLLEGYEEKLINVGERRYISIRDYCHQRICGLPKEVLAQWRQSVDSQARRWYDDGVTRHDPVPLLRVVERHFASDVGDDALYRLGEMSLESGDYAAARHYWRTLLSPAEQLSESDSLPMPGTLLTYPDTSIPAADINARLVMVSILEGDVSRADRELRRFAEKYPNAEGLVAGHQGIYVELLRNQFELAHSWPQTQPDLDWRTFAGSQSRAKIAPEAIDLGAKRWELPLTEVPYNELLAFGAGPALRRVASSHPSQRDRQRLLSYHPIVTDGKVFVNTSDEILALDLNSGEPAWSQAVIYQNDIPLPTKTTFRSGGPGVPRFSMTAANGRLYARMGPPVTMLLSQPMSKEARGYLVCLDLKSQGSLLWKIYPEQEKLTFEGAPVVAGNNIYVALRRSDVRPQAHVACYDADTGRQRWITQVCAAETIGRGQYEETTCNLLTLVSGTLYLNTNLGAVARLNARDGHLDWVRVYREKQIGDLNRLQAYLYRDMTPCLYAAERVFVAPCDSEKIYALNAETGELLWDTRYAPDAVHLLGATRGNLLASGDRLYWIDCETGKLVHYWPDAHAPKGFGRGILAGKYVYWPTRTSIYVFDQQTAALVRSIDLRTRDEVASGGNLLVVDGMLLVSTTDRLLAFSRFSQLGASANNQASSNSNESRSK